MSPMSDELNERMDRAKREWRARNKDKDVHGLGELAWMLLRGIHGYEGPDGEDTGLPPRDGDNEGA